MATRARHRRSRISGGEGPVHGAPAADALAVSDVVRPQAMTAGSQTCYKRPMRNRAGYRDAPL